jgi:hypothetical protein
MAAPVMWAVRIEKGGSRGAAAADVLQYPRCYSHASEKFHGHRIKDERDIILFVLAVPAAPQPRCCCLACMFSLFHRSSDHLLQSQCVSYPYTHLHKITWSEEQ